MWLHACEKPREDTYGASRRPALEIGGYTLPSPTRGLLYLHTLSTLATLSGVTLLHKGSPAGTLQGVAPDLNRGASPGTMCVCICCHSFLSAVLRMTRAGH